MTVETQSETHPLPTSTSAENNSEPESEKILCPHCLRTATNGIKCQGICVSDSDY